MKYTVSPDDVAAFAGEVVHPVCATFTLAREIEWATRQYMLEWRDEDEEGIGTFLSIDHRSPAFVGEELLIESIVESVQRNELICSYIVRVNDRVVATGKTGQKVLKKDTINRILSKTS
ncbi:MAG: hypothetical protein MUE95_08200 [Cyclobacteriaceae bacterium]|nr:hypothetical protein [Cyclobacteriaceae bacterium]